MTHIGLDVETQEFNAKEGITARTAKMEGLAVAYDMEWAEYETDPEKWAGKIPQNGDSIAVFHNARFDLMKFKQAGLPMPKEWECTLIAAHLADENTSHGLKDLAKHLPLVQVAEKLAGNDTYIKKYKDVDKSDKEAFAAYAQNDARFTRELWLTKYSKELAYQELEDVYELEKSIVPVVHQMQDTGLLIDEEALSAFSVTVKEERAVKKAAAFAVAGQEFPIDSPKEVGKFLYDTMKLRCKKFTKKSHAPSTDREALIDLGHPVADAILAYREMSKLETAFVNKLPGHIENGRIHPEFNPLGAATGRFSCSTPNVQQVPSKGDLAKTLRSCFIAPPGKKLVVADYEQAELRVLAHYSGDPILIANYTQEGVDLHSITAKSMFGRENITSDERKVAKIVNFGIVYGLTAQGLHRRLPSLGIFGYSLKDCEKFINKYFETYKGVRSFLNKVERRVQSAGYVKSLSGRRRRLPLGSNREIRQGQNFIIQASAADLCKTAMVNIYTDLPKDCRMVAMIHDELLIEAPEEEAATVKEIVETYIAQTPEGFRVPMRTEAKIIDRWSEK